MSKAAIQKMLNAPPPSWQGLFKKYNLPARPTSTQVIAKILEFTPTGRKYGPKGKTLHVPPASVRKAALKGLRLAHQYNYTSSSGIGLARGIQLVVSPKIWQRSITRMNNYFTRHQIDKLGRNFGNDKNPSNGYIAWLLWGGDPAQSWINQMKPRPNPVAHKLEAVATVRDPKAHSALVWMAEKARQVNPRSTPIQYQFRGQIPLHMLKSITEVKGRGKGYTVRRSGKKVTVTSTGTPDSYCWIIEAEAPTRDKKVPIVFVIHEYPKRRKNSGMDYEEESEEESEEYEVVKGISMTDITMTKKQGVGVLRDIWRGELSMTKGLPVLFYDTDRKQLLVEDGNHRIFQQWLNGEDTFDAYVYEGNWHNYLRPVYESEEKFDWDQEYRENPKRRKNPRFRVGDRVVEGRRKGKVTALHSPGTVDVLFDDMGYAIRRQAPNVRKR